VAQAMDLLTTLTVVLVYLIPRNWSIREPHDFSDQRAIELSKQLALPTRTASTAIGIGAILQRCPSHERRKS
jgi:hypothetical protein